MGKEPLTGNWAKEVIIRKEIDKYLVNGDDFINEAAIFSKLALNVNPPPRINP